MLVVKGLWKSFRPTVRGEQTQAAVAGVDLTVPTGTLASVLGPSGSGKTTLLRCIAGFERPDAGMILLGERVLFTAGTDLPAHARRVGVVPQEGALFPHLNVAQNIGFGLSSLSRGDRRERVEQLLDLVGLHGLGGRRPDQLSGGQQQRVALARALAPEPALVLLDEPFSALDARLRADLREEVRALLRSLGTTAVLVTHDQAEAMSLSDHLVVLRDGKAVAAGEPRQVYSNPADPEVAGFLGEVLVVSGTVSRGADGIRVDCGLGSLEVGQWHGEEGPCRVLIRPEQIRVRPLEAAQPMPHVVGSVESQSYFGHDALVRVNVPGVEHPVSVRVPGKQACRVGDRAALEIVESVVTYSA